jgi:outer membrane protein assembly factor BamD (BamD/ComL family)
MRLSFQAGLLLLALATASVAQNNRATLTPSQTTISECTEQLFEKAEQSFRRRVFGGSEMLAIAERQLSEVVRLCNETPGVLQAEDHLRLVHEEMADHNLSIALFYLEKLNNGKGGKEGALSRLKTISERYPQYSRLDQVLFLLGKIKMNDGNLDEAASYYHRIIRAYPNSQYIGEASMQLSAIEVLKIDQRLDAIP